MKAYKVFGNDWKCRGFQYELSKTYKHNDVVKICESGFHACIKLVDCFNYYDFNPENKVAIVELSGNMDSNEDKVASSIIDILEEISWNDVLNMVNIGKANTGYRNSGDRNSGYSNSGDRNSGNRNSGYSNSGYRNSGNSNSGNSNSGNSNSGYSNSGNSNSGNRNSGDWNNTDYETGFFNSKQSKYINVFNKKCKKDLWNNTEKPNFIYDIIINKWVYYFDMTDEEKENDKHAFIRDGYLKTCGYKEAWVNAYNKATQKDIDLLKKLPNFDSKVFYKITGIKID